MKRNLMTNEEKVAQDMIGTQGVNFNMAEGTINEIIEKENARKFNSELDKYSEKITNYVNELQESAANLSSDPNLIEIKPLYNKALIKPFEHNPFQQIKVDKKTGLIVDLGGFESSIHKSQDTGKFEEEEQMILVGAVQEVGPDCKYVQPGDVVFYMKGSGAPVPFFKQGFWCLPETCFMAVVNEGLEKRFNSK